MAAYCVSRNWIDYSKLNWCSYAIERRLETALFAFIVFAFSLITKTYLKSFSFVFTLYFFRSRMGGWHAKHVWSCQLISVGTLIVAVLLVGPILEKMRSLTLLILDILTIVTVFFTKPVYPQQAHFTQSEIKANIKSRNLMLIVLILVQGISLWLAEKTITLYSCLALMFTVMAVLLELFYNRRRFTNHESFRKNRI